MCFFISFRNLDDCKLDLQKKLKAIEEENAKYILNLVVL